MTTRRIAQTTTQKTVQTVALALLATVPLAACAQAPVDDTGKVIGAYEPAIAASNSDLAVGNEEIPLMSDVDLEVLVGPIALYPDDLLAIVLPASAYPLQIIDAARFLEELDRDSTLKPNPDWDDSVVALLNYPEVIELLNDDIDWTWRLGEAVVSQQGDVVTAIEAFRDRAYAAGNLKSDSYQNVTRDEGIIEIRPVVEDIIYVPYYEPERVVVYQPRPVYYYYPRSYPVYYYPYSSAYRFDRGFFWGVTTAFTIGWMSDSLHVYHPSFYGHPYYGHSYRARWWYRRPTMNVYNTNYVRNTSVTINRYYNGDRWSPRHDRREYVRDERVTRNRHYERNRPEQTSRTQTNRTQANRTQTNRTQTSRTQANRRQEPIEFRDRPVQRNDVTQARNTQRTQSRQQSERRTPVAVQREQQRSEPTTRQRQERREPTRQVRQEPRQQVAPQRQVRQEPRQQVAPQRQVRQEPRQQAAPQRQVRQEPRQQAAPQRQVRQEPRQQAAPQRQERRETRSEPKRSENRSSESRERKKRSSRR